MLDSRHKQNYMEARIIKGDTEWGRLTLLILFAQIQLLSGTVVRISGDDTFCVDVGIHPAGAGRHGLKWTVKDNCGKLGVGTKKNRDSQM